MPADYYSDTVPASKTAPEKVSSPDDTATAEIPRSALGGLECKPGDKLTMTVTKVMEDSILVKPEYEEKGEESESEAEPAQAPMPGGMGGGGMM